MKHNVRNFRAISRPAFTIATMAADPIASIAARYIAEAGESLPPADVESGARSVDVVAGNAGKVRITFMPKVEIGCNCEKRGYWTVQWARHLTFDE